MIIGLIFLAASSACNQVIISEVMFHPQDSSTPDEFVEVVNISDTTVDLSGWFIADLSIQYPDSLLGDQLLLKPGGYALVFEADYDTDGGTYHSLVPVNTLILSVDDYSLGNGLSNQGDSLFLINAIGDSVDAVGWDKDLEPGYSLEKVILDDCISASNWVPSLIIHGSPGKANSVAGRVVDLAIRSLTWTDRNPPYSFNITVTVENLGLAAAAGNLLLNDSVVADIPSLLAGEMQEVSFEWNAPNDVFGLYSLTVHAAVPNDYDLSNNITTADIPIPSPRMALVINEIMYTPFAGEPEWIELVNTTSSTINLDEWIVSDQTSDGLLSQKYLPGDSYIIGTGDSLSTSGWPIAISVMQVPGFPSLNNAGDQVIILDPIGTIIDEVDYSHLPFTTTGRSLEKIDPTAPSQESTSWVVSPSTQGHTAGRPNSVQVTAERTGISLDPNPLRINTSESILVVQYITPFPAINLLVEIYDLAGRKLGTIFNAGPVPGTGAVTWDARTLDQVRYRTGQYALVFRAKDTSSRSKWERMERLILVN
ncbi:MAG: lamin tail domain-containing protein [Fidelibacterota bacterium]|nr:MAG: lamin tail domain-containing protein [Candidatus Neomarinimicrobiota bacterium]